MQYMILEYLGGIESRWDYIYIWEFDKILEYLGGIESILILEQRENLQRDFRIPRRDWKY